MVAGGRAWLLGGMCCCWGACMAKGGVRGKGGHVWDTTRYGDTINEWAVRILLECVLVFCSLPPQCEQVFRMAAA